MKQIMKPAACVMALFMMVCYLPAAYGFHDAGGWETVYPTPGGDAGGWTTVELPDEPAPPAGDPPPDPGSVSPDEATRSRRSSSSSDTALWVAGGAVVVGVIWFLVARNRRAQQSAAAGAPMIEHRFNSSLSLVLDNPLPDRLAGDAFSPRPVEPKDLLAMEIGLRIRF